MSFFYCQSKYFPRILSFYAEYLNIVQGVTPLVGQNIQSCISKILIFSHGLHYKARYYISFTFMCPKLIKKFYYKHLQLNSVINAYDLPLVDQFSVFRNPRSIQFRLFISTFILGLCHFNDIKGTQDVEQEDA